ncbi:MAG: carbohydrate porin [Hyphomicrobiales bacterium]|nr:carbohydrate porin [Hyphomicrobiales bacterium]
MSRTTFLCLLALLATPEVAEAKRAPRKDDTNTPLSAAANTGQESVSDILPEPLKSWDGLRPWLAAHGLTFAATYQGDVMANAAGGIRRGATYMGRLQTTLEFDPGPTTGWTGALVHVSSFQIHGVAMSPRFTGAFNQLSDLEAVATTRLFEAWFEQQIVKDRLWLRAGQISADQEFFLSPYYGVAIGGAFGWPPITASNLPSTGPAYPFAAPAVRIKFMPTDNITLLAAVFDGDPAGPGLGNPQWRNLHGVNFRLRDRPFVIGEAQFAHKSGHYGGTLRIGAWRHFGRFADQRFDANGLPLAAPASNNQPFMHRGDWGVYGVIDQKVYEPANADDIDRRTPGVDVGAFAFARASFSPSDRNVVQYYFDGGMSFNGMVDNRPYDKFAVLGSFTKISARARAFDFDQAAFAGLPLTARDYEAIVEATYSWRAAPGVYLQPNVQYIVHPGAGAANPLDPSGLNRPRNALALGVRATLQY